MKKIAASQRKMFRINSIINLNDNASQDNQYFKCSKFRVAIQLG
jgi:hypothetical protein